MLICIGTYLNLKFVTKRACISMQVFFFNISVAQKRNTCTKQLTLELLFFPIYLLLKTLYENVGNDDRTTAYLEGSQRLFFITIVNVNSNIKSYT